MSIKTGEDFSIGAKLDVSFALMTLPRVVLKGVVSWSKPKSLGVRFEPTDEARRKVKTWIDSYLES
jgi:Tfp pilus assembly protein PilZ